MAASVDVSTLADARDVCEIACACCDALQLFDRIHIEWNSRFTARMGDARWDVRNERGLIRLSTPLWPKAPAAERVETVVHEACHIIADALSASPQRHGPKWKDMMRKCGYATARIYHEVNSAEIANRRRSTWREAACKCAEPVKLSPIRASRLKRGAQYICVRCGQSLRLE